MRNWINLFENFFEYTEDNFDPSEIEDSLVEVEFVCINPIVGGADPEKVSVLYERLKTINDVTIYREDFSEEAAHWAMCVVIEPERVKQIFELARQCGVGVDLVKNHRRISAEYDVIDIWSNMGGRVNYERNSLLPLPPTTAKQALKIVKKLGHF